MKKRKMICISCPLGCEIEAEISGDDVTVSGNRCPRGKEYALNEIKDPRRVVTSNVKVIDGVFPLASVKTTGAIPKDKIFTLIDKLKEVELKAPIKIGQVVFENLFETGFDVIVTRPVEKCQ